PAAPGADAPGGIDEEQERGWDAAPSAPPPPAPRGAPPPPPVLGGAPPRTEPAPPAAVYPPSARPPLPYPEQEQAARTGTSQRKEGGTSAGEGVRTLQFSAYHPNSLAVETWQTLLVYAYLAEALAQIQSDAATFTELGSAPTVAKGQAARAVA